MHLLVATTAHPPGDVRVHGKIAESLLDHGVEVSWVGPRSSMALYGETDPRITYEWLPPISGKVSRLLTVPQLIRAIRPRIAGTDWVYCPDPDAGLAALLARRGGTASGRIWFDIHEEYHLAHASSWLGPLDSGLTRNALRAAIRAVVKRADLVTAASPRVLDVYADGVDPARLLMNTAPSTFSTGKETPLRRNGSPLVIMHGKPGSLRGTPQLADALESLPPDVLVRVVCIGSPLDLETVIGQRRAALLTGPDRNARFEVRPAVPFADMPRLLLDCHAGVVNYSGDLAAASLPNRLFEYMAAGLAVLCASESPYVVEVTQEGPSGLVFSNADPASLASQICRLWADPELCLSLGTRGRELAREKYSWDEQFEGVRGYICEQTKETRDAR